MTYDDDGHLLSVTRPNVAKWSFAYDANGNRTHQTWSQDEAVTLGAGNRLASRGTHSYGSDGAGNRITDAVGSSTASYAYDAFNRMTSVSRNSSLGNCEFNDTCRLLLACIEDHAAGQRYPLDAITSSPTLAVPQVYLEGQ